MPIILDMTDSKGRQPRTRFDVTRDLIAKDVIDLDARLQNEKRERAKRIMEKYPHLKGARIV